MTERPLDIRLLHVPFDVTRSGLAAWSFSERGVAERLLDICLRHVPLGA